jgi:1-acyl-sn-glycerol-3-phosphate acyltransferase
VRVPPWIVRRLVLAPLMPVLAAVALALLPLVVLGQAVVAGILLLGGRRIRWRLVRVWAFGVAYLVGETGCLLACLGLWLASGLGWGLRSDRFVAAHLTVLRAFLSALLAVARLVFRFRLVVDEPVRHPEDTDRMAAEVPLIVLGRHAGPGASFVLVHLLLARYRRRPRIVLTEQLRLDPSIDVLLSRLGCAFISAAQGAGDGAVRRVAEVAGSLSGRDALVLFPEGGDWTPTRQRRAVARLRRRGLRVQAEQAERMRHVLPPRPAGALAALQHAPTADVVVFTHTGHDDLQDVATVWAALPLRRDLHMIWWRQRGERPADEGACSRWLFSTWTAVDAWIGEQTALHGLVAPQPSASFPVTAEPGPA